MANPQRIEVTRIEPVKSSRGRARMPKVEAYRAWIPCLPKVGLPMTLYTESRRRISTSTVERVLQTGPDQIYVQTKNSVFVLKLGIASP